MTALSPAETFGRVPDPGWAERFAVVRCQCACGGVLTRQMYESTRAVVSRHNRTRRHREWAAEREA